MKKDFTQVANQFIKDSSLSDSAFRTLVVLISFKYGNAGRIYPSQATIAKIRGKNRRTIIKHIKELKTKGVVESKKRGYSSTNEYFINSAKYRTIDYSNSVESSISKVPNSSSQLSQNDHTKNTKENNTKIKKGRDNFEKIRNEHLFLRKKKGK